MNIKQKLIHLLGGVTQEERNDRETNSFVMGQWAALIEVKSFAMSINGIAADDWCKTMYNHLCERLEDVEKTKEATVVPE